MALPVQPCPFTTLGRYGDAGAGAGGYAELVGGACSGSCFNASARWSES